jgi:hypothetical protein
MPANEPELVGAIRVNRPNGAFMTAPKTRLSIGLHVAPCTIPDTNPLNRADFATIRERFIKFGARVIEHTAPQPARHIT